MSDYISREAAIEAVESELAFHSYAGSTAASAIAKLPAADVRSAEYCEKCRAAVLKVVDNYAKLCADVREKMRGKWMKTVGENGVTSACRCSKCGFEDNRYSLFNFCPNCGADMREEQT